MWKICNDYFFSLLSFKGGEQQNYSFMDTMPRSLVDTLTFRRNLLSDLLKGDNMFRWDFVPFFNTSLSVVPEDFNFNLPNF